MKIMNRHARTHTSSLFSMNDDYIFQYPYLPNSQSPSNFCKPRVHTTNRTEEKTKRWLLHTKSKKKASFLCMCRTFRTFLSLYVIFECVMHLKKSNFLKIVWIIQWTNIARPPRPRFVCVTAVGKEPLMRGLLDYAFSERV